jgi:hypothetical protein
MTLMTPEASASYLDRLRAAQNVLNATPEDVDKAIGPMGQMLELMLPPDEFKSFKEDFLDKLDLTTVGDRWVLCMHVLDRLWLDIAFEMYAARLMHRSEVLGTLEHTGTMTSIFKALHGDYATDVMRSPRELLQSMLAQIDDEFKGETAETGVDARNEFVEELAHFTNEHICAAIALHEMHARDGNILQMITELMDPEKLESMGAPAALVARAKKLAERRGTKASKHPSELEAKERIHTAVMKAHKGDQQTAIVWAVHPERLVIVKGDERIPLIQGVMSDPLTTAQIIQLVERDFVIYDETLAVQPFEEQDAT